MRPHFDYCNKIYYEPSKHKIHGRSLTSLMEEIEKLQYKATFIVTGPGQVQIVTNYMKN